ncbi:hypothetical protein OPIT5_13255 [Opitutaceae bacterium TAV5]|nr:hypothetical protein OPIT5_13255 [Opitutaceae bacterium TAV5]
MPAPAQFIPSPAFSDTAEIAAAATIARYIGHYDPIHARAC